jgi:hypothetical protein
MTNPTEDLLIESTTAREPYMYDRENHLKKAMRLVAALFYQAVATPK